MRKLKIGLFAAAAFVLVGITAPAPASAQGQGDKMVICHTPGHRADSILTQGQCYAPDTKGGDPKAVEIEISVNACQAHLGGPCTIG